MPRVFWWNTYPTVQLHTVFWWLTYLTTQVLAVLSVMVRCTCRECFGANTYLSMQVPHCAGVLLLYTSRSTGATRLSVPAHWLYRRLTRQTTPSQWSSFSLGHSRLILAAFLFVGEVAYECVCHVFSVTWSFYSRSRMTTTKCRNVRLIKMSRLSKQKQVVLEIRNIRSDYFLSFSFPSPDRL